jgi:galactokinase/mevalonate kinase-like predicted kinase
MPPCSIEIPGGTTFIAVGLPTMALSIDVPSTLVIGLGASSTVVTGTLGILNLRNLSVDAGTPATLYIWAH